MTWTPTEFQKKLMEHGYPLPQFGADGYWGGETSDACALWFRDGTDLDADLPPPPIGGSIVPAAWMQDCDMDRVIVHWTAGSYVVSATDREHYHIIVGGDAQLVKGDKDIIDNVSSSDGDYAAHTKNCNSGSIGISAACMAGAIESPFKPGSYPLLMVQWETLAAIAADLCNKYGIKVTPQTVLQHGEVQENLDIAQSGKWDICKLPWSGSMSTEQVGDQFRGMVEDRM